jgi:hypothetical protein
LELLYHRILSRTTPYPTLRTKPLDSNAEKPPCCDKHNREDGSNNTIASATDDAPLDSNAEKPPCCDKHNREDGSNTFVSAYLSLKSNILPIRVLIDTGCTQTNVVSERLAALLRQDGGVVSKADIVLKSGVGGVTYGTQGIISATVTFGAHGGNNMDIHICIRAIICKDITSDLIIGLPSIKFYNLLPILQNHLSTLTCCEICSTKETDELLQGATIHYGSQDKDDMDGVRNNSPTAAQPHHDCDTTIASATHEDTVVANLEDYAPQHQHYEGPMAVLFANIHTLADTAFVPTYTDEDQLTQAIQGLHLSEILGFDDDGADEEGPNDIDISRMTENAPNDDYTIGGSPELQSGIRALIGEYKDIFSYSVKGKAVNVPSMEFTVNKTEWESNANRAASRRISMDKHEALNKLIEDLLDLGVIQPSRATAWSQVHLVRKPQNDGWRFTIDYRSLNKVISNEGWTPLTIPMAHTYVSFTH